MRLLALLLTVALVASAGCFGKDDEEPPATTTPTTGTSTTPATGATPTGATPTSPTTGGNTTTPTKPAPKEVFSGTATFAPSPGAPDPANPTGILGAPVNNPFTVAAGYTTLTLNVTWANSAPAAPTTALSVTIITADGSAVATCGLGQGAQQGVPAPCTASGPIPATGGDYVVQYSGSAPPSTVTAAVQVVAS